MPPRASSLALALTLLVALSACSDEAADAFGPDRSLTAKGGVPGPPADGGGDTGGTPGDIVALGEALFNDLSLSVNQNQGCVTCHQPSEGFAAPLEGVSTQGSVVEGSVAGRFGDRRPPTAAYATLSPIFDGSGKDATGGIFWDGRATGGSLGNPAADQALAPFLNPNEQAMPDKACVIYRVANGGYGNAWTAVWGDAIMFITWPSDAGDVCTTVVDTAGTYVSLSPADRATVEEAFDRVALSIEQFEGSASVNAASSRFDTGSLSPLEQDGEKLFSSKGKCHQCHDTSGSPAVFTDFGFHNLGVPRNPDNPVYPFGAAAFDPGLGGFTGEAAHLGKFRTPTVRNVGEGSNRTFMHNGSLQTLKQVVQFYNTRDLLPTCTGGQLEDPTQWGPDGYGCWPPPEFPENLDTRNMGNLGLSPAQVDAIVAFMEALTDQ